MQYHSHVSTNDLAQLPLYTFYQLLAAAMDFVRSIRAVVGAYERHGRRTFIVNGATHQSNLLTHHPGRSLHYFIFPGIAELFKGNFFVAYDEIYIDLVTIICRSCRMSRDHNMRRWFT